MRKGSLLNRSLQASGYSFLFFRLKKTDIAHSDFQADREEVTAKEKEKGSVPLSAVLIPMPAQVKAPSFRSALRYY